MLLLTHESLVITMARALIIRRKQLILTSVKKKTTKKKKNGLGILSTNLHLQYD